MIKRMNLRSRLGAAALMSMGILMAGAVPAFAQPPGHAKAKGYHRNSDRIEQKRKQSDVRYRKRGDDRRRAEDYRRDRRDRRDQRERGYSSQNRNRYNEDWRYNERRWGSGSSRGERDLDGDGWADWEDNDIDGDYVPNEKDYHPYDRHRP